MIARKLEGEIIKRLFTGKAIVIMGARQTGKTTLLKKIMSQKSDVLWLNADEADTIALFEEPSSTMLKQVFAGQRMVVIDEAHRIDDVGLKLKLITDQIQEVQLIATGSSAFELANRINEPLTGRKWEYKLFPLSFSEMAEHHGLMEETRLMKHRILYGYYPEVVNNPGSEKEVLKQLSEQAYIIFRLPAFSRNHRKELKRGREIYFYDNGIRNALLANFNIPDLRTDIGALWENFIISERMKFLHYNNIWANSYFWRTQDQMEIDYIEERDGM